MKLVRMRLVISGRVQGVWYRGSMETQAQRLGVTGWVKNRDDGAVEAVIEGPEATVQQMVSWCRSGPPGARVRDVCCSEEPPAGFHDFRILR